MGEAGNISGTVTAPTGGDVLGTDVFACFANEDNCERLGLTVAQTGAAAAYTLSSLPGGSYGIYAFKDVDGDGTPENGDFFGHYSKASGESIPVTPPATSIDIKMHTLTGTTPTLPEALSEPLAELSSNP